jgi:hypothetical protein
MDLKNFNRDAEVTSKSGKNVKDTSQLSGEAKNSLSGTNDTKQYETTFGSKGILGAKVQDN